MFKPDTIEAAPIVQRCMFDLLSFLPKTGRAGSDARTKCGDIIANAATLIGTDQAGQSFDDAFELSRLAGIKWENVGHARRAVEAETPITVGATMIKQVLVGFCLATESRIIADMQFVSRQDVDLVIQVVNGAFGSAEEVAANEMAQMTYQALVALHAATIRFLVDTGRPLPRLLGYRFASPLSTLEIGHRLYADAGRANELRAENRTIHPAFAAIMGFALSA